MKKLTVFFIVLMLIGSGCTQKKPAEKTILGMGTDYVYFPETLNGKIKELRETNYWAAEKDGKITRGNPITWKELDSIGSTRNLVAYFDINGVVTRYDLVDENNVVRNSNIGTFENGKGIRWESKQNDSTLLYMIPEYDTKGSFVGGKTYRPIADTVINSFAISYDENGNYTRIENFNYKGMKGSYQVLIYHNEPMKVIETQFYSKDDTLRQTFRTTFSEKGFLQLQEVIIEKPKSTETWKVQDLSFDDHGNWLQALNDVDEGKFRLVAERTYVYY
jgi:hypothetical protein